MGCFLVLRVQNSSKALKCLRFGTTVCDQFAATCTVWLFWNSPAFVWTSLSVEGCVCSQIVAPVLNYEKQQPRATLNFHKTSTASWIQVAHPVVIQTKGDGGTERGTEKKRVTDKQSTNKQKVRQSDGATALRLLLRCYQLLLLLMFWCAIMQNDTHQWVRCMFL